MLSEVYAGVICLCVCLFVLFCFVLVWFGLVCFGWLVCLFVCLLACLLVCLFVCLFVRNLKLVTRLDMLILACTGFTYAALPLKGGTLAR